MQEFITTLMMSNEEMKDFMKTVKPKDSGSLAEGATQTIQNQTKEQKGGFLGMFCLSGTLGASLLGNMLAGKGILREG